MLIPTGQHPKALAIAQALIEGFDRHYTIFREVSRAAKERFEAADWHTVQRASKERIRFYDERVDECVARLHDEFHADWLDDDIWQQAKLLFIGMLVNHKQPELAETFFNSVCCKILHRNYFHNDFIFVRPAVSTEYIESDPPTYRSYYPRLGGFVPTLKRVIGDFGWKIGFADLDRDVGHLVAAVREHLGGSWPEPEVNFQIQVLSSAFYRNKAAYIIGKAVNGSQEFPFAIPVLHDEAGRLRLDTILLEPARIAVLFSLNRAYFMVDMASPSGYVGFLRSMLPFKPKAELYTMLGLAKQGKTVFYRDLMHHLRHSRDDFMVAPGIRGLVMLVFTLPSFPYVFKLIKDEIAPTKDVTKEIVRDKYLLVKQHDRVGRMADTLEFSNVALPKQRFTEELLDELRRLAPSLLEEDGDEVVIRHLYIERRMEPLNLFLNRATPEQLERAVIDYGNAIRELATANIFPGDMLFKNFGITRYGRVVFYDYDEIEYMTDCNFREIPEAPTPEMEMASEPWYPVARNDVFPEEFARFLLGPTEIRRVFLQHHRDLLDARFWRARQERIRGGHVEDFFPYPAELRFAARFPAAKT
ncbi:bifunctional isocitrate dehydrogenase kinase/phosphatase [Chitinimonas koreensis]|uniref:bifunctional isocitrate dehydrogenase kinase/phosphatase n=1 Tax=Chitinimonas koreensis TaxID=356302 RepID=UPI0004030843|nr:bifunctional isocitrate dehydrogenase kinase/phosphatase [Chitinimonas koreensis]QNM97270.1 bifunctional isocitrate dehydrogenase kinase/phosphatase [Chitinimonas koreensis]